MLVTCANKPTTVHLSPAHWKDWNSSNCGLKCLNTKVFECLCILIYFLFSQGEADSWREPVNGAERGPGSLCGDDRSTHHLSHVAPIGPEPGSVHISQTDALNKLITWSNNCKLKRRLVIRRSCLPFFYRVHKCYPWHGCCSVPWMNWTYEGSPSFYRLQRMTWLLTRGSFAFQFSGSMNIYLHRKWHFFVRRDLFIFFIVQFISFWSAIGVTKHLFCDIYFVIFFGPLWRCNVQQCVKVPTFVMTMINSILISAHHFSTQALVSSCFPIINDRSTSVSESSLKLLTGLKGNYTFWQIIWQRVKWQQQYDSHWIY